MRDRLFTFAFDQLKDRLVAGCVVRDFQTLPSQLGNDFFDRSRFMQLNQSAASAASICPRWRFAEGQQFLTKLSVEQIQIQIFLMKFADCFLVIKIMHGFLVSLAHLYQVRWKLARLGISLSKISFEIAAMPTYCFA